MYGVWFLSGSLCVYVCASCSPAGLSRHSVRLYAGVLECRGQEETFIWAGGEDTGDPAGGKPH